MATVSFNYKERKKTNIEVRFNFIQDGKYKYQKSGILIEKVTKQFWKEYEKGTRFQDADKQNLQKEIQDKYSELSKVILEKYKEADHLKNGWLKKVIFEIENPSKGKKQPVPKSLVKYWNYYLDNNKSNLSKRSRQKWEEVLNKIIKFEKYTNESFLIKDVDHSFANKWKEYGTLNQYSEATTIKNFAYIKMICRNAETKGIEISKELRTAKIKKEEKPLPKIYLSFQELEEIQKLQRSNEFTESLENARDWLIISCFTGQRVSDFMRFNTKMITEDDGKRFIHIHQQKTNAPVTIPLLPEVEAILQKRNGEFPKRISDQRYNDYIKVVCKLAGINEKIKGKIKKSRKGITRGYKGIYPKYKLISSHVGRRSFATNYYGKVSTVYLMNITAHKKESTFLNYIGKGADDLSKEAFDLLVNVKK